MSSKEELAKKRQARTQELADKLKNGTYSQEDTGIAPISLTNYPPRPKTKKDSKALERIYGEEEKPLK